eukprot:scaffold246_cov414-Prasinococcus_capsulatus_cf.AAC.4
MNPTVGGSTAELWRRSRGEFEPPSRREAQLPQSYRREARNTRFLPRALWGPAAAPPLALYARVTVTLPAPIARDAPRRLPRRYP